jgi:hypothetical protein
MTDKFDIIEYLSGLTGYVFDKAVLKRIALDRGVAYVTDFAELNDATKELLRADLLYCAYLSPNVRPSSTVSHGSFSNSVGSQTIYAIEKERLYNAFISIYRKYEDEKLQEIESVDSTLQWM